MENEDLDRSSTHNRGHIIGWVKNHKKHQETVTEVQDKMANMTNGRLHYV